MNPLEQEYLDNVERAKARDRWRELVIAWLTSGFIRPMSDVALDDVMDGRTRDRARWARTALAVLLACASLALGLGTARQRSDAGCELFVLAFAGLILAWKYLYGRFRRWHNARLEREWERRLGLETKDRR